MKKLLIIFLLILLSFSLQGQIIRAMPFYKPSVAEEAPSYGPELCIDPGFDNSGDWIIDGTTFTISGGHGIANNVSADGSLGMYNDPEPIVAGHTYHIVFTVSGYVDGEVYIALEGGGTGEGIHRTADGTYTQDLVAEGSGYLYIQGADALSCFIDNLSCKEVL